MVFTPCSVDLFNASLVLLYFGSCLKVSSLQFLLQNHAQLDVLLGVSITSFMPPILHLTKEVRSALNQDKVKFSYELGEGVAEGVWPGPRCYSIPSQVEACSDLPDSCLGLSVVSVPKGDLLLQNPLFWCVLCRVTQTSCSRLQMLLQRLGIWKAGRPPNYMYLNYY